MEFSVSDPAANDDGLTESRKEMMTALLNLSSAMFVSDPLFHARCQITGSTMAYACHRIGEPMTREVYAAVMQAAAVALVLGSVDDEDLAESVDHGKVLVSMLDFERVQAEMQAQLDREREEQTGVDD